ncbi:hypothetical protein [Actinoallomurus acanthiterrae]
MREHFAKYRAGQGRDQHRVATHPNGLGTRHRHETTGAETEDATARRLPACIGPRTIGHAGQRETEQG